MTLYALELLEIPIKKKASGEDLDETWNADCIINYVKRQIAQFQNTSIPSCYQLYESFEVYKMFNKNIGELPMFTFNNNWAFSNWLK